MHRSAGGSIPPSSDPVRPRAQARAQASARSRAQASAQARPQTRVLPKGRHALIGALRTCELQWESQPDEVHRQLTELTHRIDRSGDSALQAKWLVLKALTSLELGDAPSVTLHLRAAMLALNEFDAQHALKQELKEELLKDLKEMNASEDATWESFRRSFAKAHPRFVTVLMSRCPVLSPMEVKICMLIRASVQSREIAEMVSITKRAIENHRYHIRRKLGLGPKENLTTYLMLL